ncbi:MAG: adenosine deaminase [Acidimicrobiia bacterium]|jgi:adenosine deaminase|nr:MAG: adenosine deaminase [Acidimicrobiia bacterium]
MDIASLPKVLLHDHLDGGLRPTTILELAEEVGYGGLPADTAEGLEEWFDQGTSGSLPRYLEAFTHTVAVLQTAPAIERVAYECGVDLHADGVVYFESRYAPSLSTEAGLSRREVLEAMAAGFRRAEQETGVLWGIIVDAMRQDTDSVEVAQVAIDSRDLGVVAFDLAGPEAGFPPDDHLEACRMIREANMGLTIHAGEADGPDSMWRAIQRCGAHRLGHGGAILVDCMVEEDAVIALGSLATYVRDFRVALEMCPYSNTHTSGRALARHPIRPLHDAGFNVTVNTDNRLMSRTSMTKEMTALHEVLGFTRRDLERLTMRALKASFSSQGVKDRLYRVIKDGFAE